MTNVPQYRLNHTEIVYETIDSETVIVDLETGSYYSLIGAGSVIWIGLVTGRTTQEIVGQLAREYDAGAPEISNAVSELIQELVQERLVVADSQADAAVSPEAAWDKPRDPAIPKREFRVPRLEKHVDMQELLLLDPVHEVDQAGWPRARNAPDQNG